MDAIPLLTRTTRLWQDKADFFKPFRKAARDSAIGENIRPLFDPELAHEHSEADTSVSGLNDALQTLVDVFPDVEPEVFRDMLTSISEESRVALVTEHMLRKSLRAPGHRKLQKRRASSRAKHGVPQTGLVAEEMFRGDEYHNAVRTLFYQEFRALSHSTIRGVMAENNGSYTRSRPVLQLLSSKTWRMSLANLWSRKAVMEDLSTHPAITWQSTDTPGVPQPYVRATNNRQLNQELFELLVRPILDKRRQDQLASDQALAFEVNEAEAVEHAATYDCECCYSAVSFEQLATCDNGDHFLCFDCVKRTTSEAVYGQGWARSVDLDKTSIRCFAPALQECQASIPAEYVRRAVQQDLEKPEVWNEFSRRVTAEVLLKSRANLQRCPGCTYAEIDETPTAMLRTTAQLEAHLAFKLRQHMPAKFAEAAATILMPLVLVWSMAAVLILLLLSLLLGLALLIAPATTQPVKIGTLVLQGPLASIAGSSLSRVYKIRRGLKFRCQDPTCLQVSCIRCLARWRDPHVCFDTEKTSLRTAIEASATAAVKRTCPRCFLSFVKSSGCNKLVCNCGYTMCYICREHITAKEGYAHFCQHFRPMGGRCTECDRCDLYGDEDETVAIKRAVEMAEKEWRSKEANRSEGESIIASTAMVEAVVGQGKRPPFLEGCIDAVLDAVVTFKSD